ncbi:DMT family transporter [Streptosporangium sp. NPDC003464]
MKRSSVLQFLLLGLIWGGSYTFIKISLDGLTPALLVFVRIVLGAVVLLAFVGLRRVRIPAFGAIWGHIAVAAILGMVAPFLLLAWGERYTSAAMAGVIIAALPLLTLVAVWILLPSEKTTRRKLAGFLLGFAGVVLIIAPWNSDAGSLTGQLAVLGAAACYAAQTVYVRRFLLQHGLAPLALAASQLVAATLLQGAVLPFTPWQTPTLSWPVVTSIVILGAIGTGLAYVLYFRLISDLGATSASAVNYLVPVVGMLTSTLLLGDTVTWNMVVGVVAVLIGLAAAENRLASLRPRPPAEADPGPPPPAPASTERAPSLPSARVGGGDD